MNSRRVGLAGLAALALLALIALVAVLQTPATTAPCVAARACTDRQTNAAWLGVEWVNESHDDDEVAQLAAELRERRIRHAYLYVSYLKPEGRFNATYSRASTLTRTLHRLDPDLDVQAWLGLPLRNGKDASAGYINLDDAATLRQVVDFARALVTEMGFDGVHLDPEPVLSGDALLLTLLDNVRHAIGPDKTLSIAARRIQPSPLSPFAPVLDHYAWRPDYYRDVAQRVDQVAVMIYDSGLPTPRLYRWWTTRQVIDITETLHGYPIDLLFGVPTSEEETRTHRPSAENMASGLLGVRDGLRMVRAVPTGRVGVAIYPYWETSEAEWAQYKTLWLNE